jgi:L-asparaginase
VEIIHSHAGATDKTVQRLFADPADAPRGLIVAGTGNATVHEALLQPLQALIGPRVMVMRSTRCVLGTPTPRDDDTLPLMDYPPAVARVLMQVSLSVVDFRRSAAPG